jgi:peptidoglycan/LPS O-acetylase OafA/YrhL
MDSRSCAPTVEPIIRPRMPELDTIRGIAILSVFAFHALEYLVRPQYVRPLWEQIPLAIAFQGWAGVNLFFVLSGFLITGILLDSRDRPTYFSRFYLHRALRILPAYYLMLLVLLLLGRAGIFVEKDLGAFLALSLIYMANLAPMFGVNVAYWVLWSLAVEEHFYLVWPTVVRYVSRRWLTILAISICVIEPMLRLYALYATREPWWGGPYRSGSFRYTWLSSDGLAMGALLAIFARSTWGQRTNLLRIVLLMTGATVAGMVASIIIPPVAGVWLRGNLVNSAAVAIVGGSLWLGTGPYRKWTNIRVLSFYGYISYGLYLIHNLILALYKAAGNTFAPALYLGTDLGKGYLRLFLCLIIATGIAYVSRITFEEYFLRLKDRPAKVNAAVSSPEAA